MVSTKIDRRAFLQGIGGIALALPVLEAMGTEVEAMAVGAMAVAVG